jgi:hypothetical protein
LYRGRAVAPGRENACGMKMGHAEIRAQADRLQEFAQGLGRIPGLLQPDYL